MTTTSALMEGRTEVVHVRLSEIPVEIREQVASDLADSWGLTGIPAIMFRMWAVAPREDAVLEVSVEKAHRLLVEGKRPLGATPKYEPPSELLDAEARVAA